MQSSMPASLLQLTSDNLDSSAKNGNNDASSTSGGGSPSSHHNTLSPAHNSPLPNTPTSVQQHTLNQAFLGKYTGQRNTGPNAFQYPSSIYQTPNQSSGQVFTHHSQLLNPITTSSSASSAINANAYYLEMFNSQQGLGSGETAIVKMEPPTSAHLPYQSEHHAGTTDQSPSRSPSVEHESHHEGLAINGTANNDIARHDRPTVVSISG